MALLTPLRVIRDIGGYAQTQANDSRAFSNVNQDLVLTAGTVSAITVPYFPNPNISVIAYFEFTAAADVFVLPAASPTLTAPSGTVRQTLAELNPTGRAVVQGQTLQFLTAQSDVNVSIAYYSIEGQPGQ